MMLSLTCRAAIKAVIYLGSQLPAGGRSSLRDVSAYIGENEHTVGKLLQKLVKAGVVCSAKGPGGGFYLTPKQTAMPVISIVEAIDGKDVFKQCGLGLSRCSDTHPCPFHEDYKPIREQFSKLCREKRVLDLYSEVNEGSAFLLG